MYKFPKFAEEGVTSEEMSMSIGLDGTPEQTGGCSTGYSVAGDRVTRYVSYNTLSHTALPDIYRRQKTLESYK